MGAINLKVDDKTKQRFRHVQGAANPESHRRRSISLALESDDIDRTVRGVLTERQLSRNNRGRSRGGMVSSSGRGRGSRGRGRNLDIKTPPNGRILCQTCSRDYAASTVNRCVLYFTSE